ncbi:MAG: hypothetical protein M0R80_30585 [Proteobacteria bacterium]|jgi:hypothetical protein|nr:hypothetical protein [Pseudomonadota bacterium]
MRVESKPRVALATCLALAAALSLPVDAAARETGTAEAGDPDGAASRLDGDLAKWPTVTVALENATANDALAAVAARVGLDYVAPAAGPGGDVRMTLSMKRRPGREALETILEVAGMRASIRGGMLVVSAEPAVPPAETAASQAAAQVESSEPVPQPAPAAAPQAFPQAAATPEPPAQPDDDDQGRRRRRHDGKRRELVRFGEPLRVEAGEVVDQAVAVGGPLTIAGTVLEDAVCVGGPVTLEPTAVVEGDVVSVGGSVDVQPGATVHGDRVGIGGPMGGIVGRIVSGGGANDVPIWLFVVLGVVSALVKAAVVLLIGLLVISFLPERYARVRDQLVRRPGRSALAGLIMALAIVPLCILLAVTVIGIPLIPIAGLFLFLLMVLGGTAFASWLGDKLPIFRGRKSQFGALALGTAVVFLVGLIPVVGGIAVAAVSFVSAGAALLSKLGAPPKGAPESGAGAPAAV